MLSFRTKWCCFTRSLARRAMAFRQDDIKNQVTLMTVVTTAEPIRIGLSAGQSWCTSTWRLNASIAGSPLRGCADQVSLAASVVEAEVPSPAAPRGSAAPGRGQDLSRNETSDPSRPPQDEVSFQQSPA